MLNMAVLLGYFIFLIAFIAWRVYIINQHMILYRQKHISYVRLWFQELMHAVHS